MFVGMISKSAPPSEMKKERKKRCFTAELTNSGIGISEVRSLPGLDIMGLAASPLTFSGGLAYHVRRNQLLGENVMSAHRW